MAEKPRLVRVRLSSAEERNELLKESSKLKNGQFKHVFINAERPYLDRKEALRLRREMLRLRNENPNDSIRIQKGKLYVGTNVVDEERPLNHLFINR